MAFCGEASTWAKLSLLLVVMGFAFHCTGYGTNYWIKRNSVRDIYNFGIGLWRMTDCSGDYVTPCKDKEIPATYDKPYVKGVQAMESLALVFIFFPMLCLIFYIGSFRARKRMMAIASMTILFLAAACSIIGMMLWIVKIPDYHYPGWSMGLTVFASALCITAAILLIPDIREYDYKDILKVGGEFQNLPATSESNEDMYRDDMKPVVEAHRANAAPAYHFLNYDKGRKMDGF